MSVFDSWMLNQVQHDGVAGLMHNALEADPAFRHLLGGCAD
jgi:hypothetical protein